MSAAARLDDELAAYVELRQRWAADPLAYASERLGLKPTWQQRSIIEAVAEEGSKTSVRSGHGTGKTAGAAGSILWFLETRDFAKVPCTAPTSAQLRDVLWAEIGKWMRRSDAISAAREVHPALYLSSLFRATADRIYDPSARGEWFAVARTSGRENPDALQGFHASDIEISDDGKSVVRQPGENGELGRIMFVIDEASGVFEGVFEVAEGALAGPGSRLLMLANPTRSKGYFADSHTRNRAEYKTIHLRSQDSPLVDPSYRETLVRKWGENSNVVRVRADGDFPLQDDDVLIAFEWCESAITRPAYRNEAADIRVSIDPARFGNDRTVLIVRQGRNLLHAEVHGHQDTMKTVGQAINLRRRYDACGIWVGVAGFAGIADRLREQGEHVVEVVEGGAAPRKSKDDEFQPHLVRDAMWFEGRKWLRDEEPSFAGIDKDVADDLAGELSAIKFTFDSSGRLKVESKEELKKPKRLGRSPDVADAVLISLMPDKSIGRYATAGEREF